MSPSPRRPLAAGAFVAVLLLTSFTSVRAADPYEVVEGTLLVEHGDALDDEPGYDHGAHPDGGSPFDPDAATYTYVVETAEGERVELDIARGTPSADPGSEVRAVGQQVEADTLLVADGSQVEPTAGAEEVAAATTKRVAVLLFNFAFDTRQPWTVSQVQSAIFGGTRSTATYFAEASNGGWSLTGDVFGYHTINVSDTGTCAYANWAAAARSAVTATGVDLAGYTNVQYIFPKRGACSWSGLASLGGASSWLNGTISVRISAHELGHNFEAHHANTYRCTAGGSRVPISASCTSNEYGDPFDAMGSGTSLPHAWHRRQMGLMTAGAVQTATASGTYTIAPLGSGSGVQLLRIARPDTSLPYLYLDYRRPAGTFDTWATSEPIVNGVGLRLAPDTSWRQSQLIDAAPTTTTFDDAPLPAGGSVYDPVGKVTVQTIRVGSSGATVSVTFDAPPPPPSLQPTPTAPPPPPTDAVAPQIVSFSPADGAGGVSRTPRMEVRFDELVSGMSSASVVLVDAAGGSVALAVRPASDGRGFAAEPRTALARGTKHTVRLTSAIRDAAGNALAPRSWSFTTAPFSDVGRSPFSRAIHWAAATGVTTGCDAVSFCPTQPVTRGQMASFLVRALELPRGGRDAFGDDRSSIHQADINALAASGITGGCGPARFCPEQVVTRAQMASFLVRALDLPRTGRDAFSDDARSIHQADINALAASGITGGCASGNYCPSQQVTREQMVEFLYRALASRP